MAFYANLFRNSSGHLGNGEDILTDESSPLSSGEEEFILEAISDGIGASDPDFPGEVQAQELGLPAFPARVTRALLRIDQKFGRNAGRHAIFILRQVYRYLTDEELAVRIRHIVAEAIGANTRVLIGHSLGSVVLYDMILRGEITRSPIPKFITIGSPLSWPTVKRMLESGTELRGENMSGWSNIYDPRDAVTGGMGLQDSHIENTQVSNGLLDPHAAIRYLKQPSMGLLLTARS
ncbi:hypothetical protein [Streptomyces atratus]|uniref:hypothetical protein n=1 Tax=Streptomyces atratus TaxID=1893 RepID=UPI002258F087|nr:hypothetical protein [Streptomyces atratus]MCX5343705.1 hypothetical protein [Streptomyces atratus]